MYKTEIKPQIGLGGILLGQNVADLKPLFPSAYKIDFIEIVSQFSLLYWLCDRKIAAEVDVRNGRIYGLGAHEGYLGAWEDKISVGMTFREARASEPRLFYDEANDRAFCKGVDGIAFYFGIDDPNPNEVDSLTISTISVFKSFRSLVLERGLAWESGAG